MLMNASQKIAYSSMITDFKNEREEHDFYPTPRCAIEALYNIQQISECVWEPACGDGAISSYLEEKFYHVYKSDIVCRIEEQDVQSFFDYNDYSFNPFKNKQMFDIITNPPFKYAQEFIEHALKFNNCRRVIMFLRLGFLEGKKRKKMYESTPLQYVYVFSWRVPTWRNGEVKKGGKGIPFMWLVWDKEYFGEPTVKWL